MGLSKNATKDEIKHVNKKLVGPLAEDIAKNSYAAAFSDSRFPPLSESELDDISIHLSILSQAEIIHCQSDAELTQQLRPDINGLILDDGRHRTTFLPSVWEFLPNPGDFVRHLKNKVGLPINDWSPNLRAYRYPRRVSEHDKFIPIHQHAQTFLTNRLLRVKTIIVNDKW